MSVIGALTGLAKLGDTSAPSIKEAISLITGTITQWDKGRAYTAASAPITLNTQGMSKVTFLYLNCVLESDGSTPVSCTISLNGTAVVPPGSGIVWFDYTGTTGITAIIVTPPASNIYVEYLMGGVA